MSENFTKAAAELGVSRVAVSRQIADLEHAIGQRLFQRNHRKVSLTRSGEAFAKLINPAMDQIAEALAVQRAAAEPSRISVTITQAFATYWLMPRLMEFGALHPELEINLVVADRYLDIASEGIDVAVRYTPEPQLGPGWSTLIQETIVPVFSPRYTPRTALTKPEHLRDERLLYLSGRYRPEAGWRHWFSQHGLNPPEERSGAQVNTYINMLQAAIEGQGIALAGSPLVDSYLADRTLQTVPEISPLPRDFYYIFEQPRHEGAAIFCDWLKAKI